MCPRCHREKPQEGFEQRLFGQERGGEGGEGASRAHTCARAAARTFRRALVRVCTRVCVRLCTCALPGAAWEGAEVSELPGGQPRAHKAQGRGGGKEQDGFFAIQLTLEAPRARAGKTEADQSSHYVPGLSQAAWHKGLSPVGWGPALKGEPSGQHRHHWPPALSREQHRG